MNTLPDAIKGGATLNYDLSLPDYPASAGWVVTLYLNGASATYSAAATADGDQHLLQVPSSTTETWVVGDYSWQIWAALGSERYPVQEGQIKVQAGLPGAAAGTDTRSDAQIGLDNIRAMMLALTGGSQASGGVKRYRIGGRELERYGMEELRSLETRYITLVKAEKAAAAIAAGRPNPRSFQVRMGRA